MSTPDENQPTREALQRDAAGVPKPDFNPALHYSTMRHVRGLAEKPPRSFRLAPALAAAAAVLALVVGLALWQMRALPVKQLASNSRQSHPHSMTAMQRSSLLTYQAAADKGDDALFALLDRDAGDLLPPSSPVFNTPFK